MIISVSSLPFLLKHLFPSLFSNHNFTFLFTIIIIRLWWRWWIYRWSIHDFFSRFSPFLHSSLLHCLIFNLIVVPWSPFIQFLARLQNFRMFYKFFFFFLLIRIFMLFIYIFRFSFAFLWFLLSIWLLLLVKFNFWFFWFIYFCHLTLLQH